METYVPRDEVFEGVRKEALDVGRLKGVTRNLIPFISTCITKCGAFKQLSDVQKIYKRRQIDEMKPENGSTSKSYLPMVVSTIQNALEEYFKFNLPRIISSNGCCIRDDELERQALAGINPLSIKRLETFPPVSDLNPSTCGVHKSALREEHIISHLDGMSVQQELNLRPIAIEPSLPQGKPSKQVLTPPLDATSHWLWQIAKAHVSSNDAGVHQLVHHWGMAEPDPTQPHGLRLVVEDYPYANDGLLIWFALENLVRTYVNYYYPDEMMVQSDSELQAWYSEAVHVGHADHANASWWPRLSAPSDLTSILTTLIWVASVQHSAVNFGQYPLGGYVPMRSPHMKKLLPKEGDPEYKDLLEDPEGYLLSCLPNLFETTKFLAVVNILSQHSPDEEYLGQRKDLSDWAGDPEIIHAFYEFSMDLKRIEKEIENRNKDPKRRNRCAAGIPPYELLMATSGPGVTCRGVPNSISGAFSPVPPPQPHSRHPCAFSVAAPAPSNPSIVPQGISDCGLWMAWSGFLRD
ncbi:hypothetical protein Fmac_009832 [Flemingia macrophylla]|uniref:Lipoxygenase domain-containing protein n=1 Tax=Flemingia macrophylla TaxID=520843 RepID=A0ABD1N1C1_9FABA